MLQSQGSLQILRTNNPRLSVYSSLNKWGYARFIRANASPCVITDKEVRPVTGMMGPSPEKCVGPGENVYKALTYRWPLDSVHNTSLNNCGTLCLFCAHDTLTAQTKALVLFTDE